MCKFFPTLTVRCLKKTIFQVIEGGNNLGQGVRQELSIARSLLRCLQIQYVRYMFFYLVFICLFYKKGREKCRGRQVDIFAHVGLGGGGGRCVDGYLGQGFGGEQLLVLST